MWRDTHKGDKQMKDTVTRVRELRQAQARKLKRDALLICGGLVAMFVVLVVMLARLQ